MSILLSQTYVCGGLVTAAGASVFADLFSESDVPLSTRAVAIVVAGVTWPVVLIGLLQLVCIGVVKKVFRSWARRNAGDWCRPH